MKTHVANGRKLMAGLLALALLTGLCTAALAEDAPLLMTDVTWEMTPEEVMEAEGAAGADTAEAYDAAGAQYVFTYPAEGDEPLRQVAYAFIGGQLMMYGCTVLVSNLPEGTDPAAYYDSVLARLTALYGGAPEEETYAITMMQAMIAAGQEDDAITAYMLWDLGDGSLLYLEHLADTTITYTFVNADTLFGNPI